MSRPVILDTQLLVLLAVGVTSRPIISKHKRLTAFTPDDFELLLLLIGDDPALILTPNTVSEAANLLRYHGEPELGRIMASFRALVRRNVEHYVPSAAVVEHAEYARLGITDTALLELAGTDFEIITADAALHIAAGRLGLASTNFNHKREDFRLV